MEPFHVVHELAQTQPPTDGKGLTISGSIPRSNVQTRVTGV
jgi:hypothetical protein